MEILRQALLLARNEMRAFERLPYRRCPSFLGDFTFVPYDCVDRLPNMLLPAADELAHLWPYQVFNAAFIQRYREGESVKRHRDPRNNVGHTLIAVFGEFTGAVSTVEDEEFCLSAGDVLKLPCTIDGVQGPPHSVSPVLSGTRYTLILNTIER